MADIPNTDAARLAHKALRDDDAAGLRDVLNRYPELKAMINAPVLDFDSPPITCARSAAMLDVLLDAGADINARSKWWAGGFGLLDSASPELSRMRFSAGRW